MPSKRILRHWRLRIKTVLFFPAVMLVGYLAGACFLGAWRMSQQDRIFPPVLMLCAGMVLTGFCAVLAGEFARIYQRWQKEQAMQDVQRCTIDTCDEVLRKPYARVGTYGGICLPCLRRVAQVLEEDAPQRAREAGA